MTTTTPKTDLEIFQAYRIEALEKELQKSKELLKEVMNGMEDYKQLIN